MAILAEKWSKANILLTYLLVDYTFKFVKPEPSLSSWTIRTVLGLDWDPTLYTDTNCEQVKSILQIW